MLKSSWMDSHSVTHMINEAIMRAKSLRHRHYYTDDDPYRGNAPP